VNRARWRALLREVALSSPPERAVLEFVGSSGEEAQERLFRFEIRLQAIDRFFNPGNHPARSKRQGPFEESYGDELLAVERQLGQALHTTQGLLGEAESGVLVFQSYVESQWITDEARDAFLQQHSTQSTPRDSLFLLQEGLQSLFHLARALRVSGQVNLLGFDALGRQYRSLIASSRYFNPFRSKRFALYTPAHRKPFVRRAVQGITSPRLRRAMLLMVAVLERYLGILSMINEKGARREEMLDALPFLALLRSEFRILKSFLEGAFVTRWLPPEPGAQREDEFRARVDSLAFELGADVRRVFTEFLIDYSGTRNARRMRGSLEAAHGLLTVFFEQALVSILGFGIPGVTVRQVFPDAEIRLQESRRLREDLWLFGHVLGHVIEQILREDVQAEYKQRVYRGLLDFLTYFENLGFQLVRFVDREAFEHFFGEMRGIGNESFEDPMRLGDVVVNFECFKIYIQTVLGQVCNRADLQEDHFDEVRARGALKQFTSALVA
jgi:hypothetical protein